MCVEQVESWYDIGGATLGYLRSDFIGEILGVISVCIGINDGILNIFFCLYLCAKEKVDMKLKDYFGFCESALIGYNVKFLRWFVRLGIQWPENRFSFVCIFYYHYLLQMNHFLKVRPDYGPVVDTLLLSGCITWLLRLPC